MGSPDYREQFTFVAGQLDRFGLAYLHIVDGLAFGFHNLGEPMPDLETEKIGEFGHSLQDGGNITQHSNEGDNHGTVYPKAGVLRRSDVDLPLGLCRVRVVHDEPLAVSTHVVRKRFSRCFSMSRLIRRCVSKNRSL
jgi:hypothetical protein